MRRRQFLATIGATAAAGCAGETPSTDAEPTTAPPTEPPATPTTTAAPTTDRPTTEPESTPTRGEVLTKRGRDHIRAAVDAFVEEAGGEDPTIVDVTAATAEFSRFDVDREYRAAIEDLNDARGFAEGELAEEVEDLIAVAEFVNALGFAQIQLVNTYGRVTTAVRTLYDESYGRLDDDVGDVRSQRRLAAQHAATVRETVDPSAFDAVDVVSKEQYEVKMGQIDRELATFDDLATHLDGLGEPMEAFEDDVADYTARRYEGVSFASASFEDARDGLAAIEPAESLRPIVEELSCVFDALASGAIQMQKAVLAQRNGDRSTAGQYEADAEEQFQACESLVEEVKPVTDLVDSL